MFVLCDCVCDSELSAYVTPPLLSLVILMSWVLSLLVDMPLNARSLLEIVLPRGIWYYTKAKTLLQGLLRPDHLKTAPLE